MLELVRVVSLKERNHSSVYIILFFLITAFLLFCVKIFDSCKTIGVYDGEGKILNFSLPYDKVKLINEDVQIIYNNESLEFDDLRLLEIHVENGILVQDFSVEIENQMTKVMDLKIMNNKQRLVKKIYNLMKEG